MTSIKWRRHQFHALLVLGLGHFRGEIADLPDQSSRIVQGQSGERTLQRRNLMLLLGHHAAHQSEMLLAVLLQVLLHVVSGSLESAARLFETTGEHRDRAFLLQVRLQFLSGQDVDVASVGTRDGNAAALQVVGGQSVGHEFLAAISARQESFRTVPGLVLAQMSAVDFDTALIFTVQRFVAAVSDVVL